MDEQYPIVYVLAIPFSFFIHRKSEFLFVIVFFSYIFTSKAAALDDGSGEA